MIERLSVPLRARPMRSVLVLIGGTAAAQAVTVLASPLLTRVYDPADLGELGIYVSFFLVALVTVSLRFELAVVSARDDRRAVELLILCALLLPIVALLGSLVLFGLQLFHVGEFNRLTSAAVPFAFVGLIVAGALSVLRYWAIRRHAFAPVSRALFAQSVVRALAQLLFGVAGLGVIGLIAGDTAGRVGGLRQLLADAISVIRRESSGISSGALLAAARDNWRFPALSVPSSLLDALGLALPAPMIAAYYGVAPAGLFVLVQRVLAAPMAVIGTSVADVFHARLSEEIRVGKHGARRLVIKTSFAVFLASLPFGLLVVAFGEPAFAVIFGDEWRDAGRIAALVVPWSVAQLTVSPVSRTVYVMSGQKLKLLYDLTSIAATIGATAGSFSLGFDVFGAVTVLAAVQVVAYGFYFGLVLRIAGRQPPNGFPR